MFASFLNTHEMSEFRFDNAFLPTIADRAFWDTFADGALIREAEQKLDFSWPIVKATDFMEFKKSGNRRIMQEPHFARREHLTLFALAELMENQGRFLPQIVNGLMAICEETFWGLSAHWPNSAYEFGYIQSAKDPYIDLYAAETGEHLCVIATLLREPLEAFCPDILERIDYELTRRIKEPYLCHRDWGWMGYHSNPNNWNPWILSNVLTVFLLSEPNERILHRGIKKMLQEIRHYYDGLPEDGGCDEGANYWGHAGASLFEFLYQLKQASYGEIDFFVDAKLGRIASFMKKVHIVDDLYVNVADSHPTGKAGMMPLLFGFAEATGQKDLMRFAAGVYRSKGDDLPPTHQGTYTLRRIIYKTLFVRRMMAFDFEGPLHPPVELLPDLQLAVLREGDWVLAAKGGHNRESHNHNDVGSYALYDEKTPVLIDVGIGTYTRFTFQKSTRYTMIPWTQSSYHCLPAVNGMAESYGGEYAADSFAAERGSIRISFAGAYPEEAGLETLERSLSLSKDCVVCTDRFVFAKGASHRVCEMLMSVLPVRIENGAAILGEKYRVSCDGAYFEAEWIAFEDETLESDWKTKGVWRLRVKVEDAECISVRIEKLCKEDV